VTVLDRRTIRLTLYDAAVKDPLVCIERKIRGMDNSYVQAAVSHHWVPSIYELWGLYMRFRKGKIEMPDDPEETLELINKPYRCIEYAAEQWLRENYPREHAELFVCTGGSFFRPIKEFLA